MILRLSPLNMHATALFANMDGVCYKLAAERKLSFSGLALCNPKDYWLMLSFF